MSEKKKVKKYGNISIPAQSLHPPEKDGYLTKVGGSIRTWKRRYFILKNQNLYYYKTPKDQLITGKIDLEPSSVVKVEPNMKKGSGLTFSVTTAKRTFFMYPDKEEELKEWMDAIHKAIEDSKKGEGSRPSGTESSPNSNNSNNVQMAPRTRLNLAKGVIGFLKEEESKVLEFWQIWSESIPSKEDLTSGMTIDFLVATSADMQKLTWRVGGPQNIFIQKMVDFFWNVGAPESEIDRLNDVGALINPVKIGSWIDMSGKGGMDGGWFFPVDVPLKLAIEAADPGDAISKFGSWAESHGISSIFAVGRDMGAAPPRQTELGVKLPGTKAEDQLKLALEAWSMFDIPTIPEEPLNVLKKSNPDSGLCLSVITSSEGFVRVGILVPKPRTETVLDLCVLAGGSTDDLAAFEACLPSSPAFVEYQHLMKGFGYGVYKEGFDIVFHYRVGEETPPQNFSEGNLGST